MRSFPQQGEVWCKNALGHYDKPELFNIVFIDELVPPEPLFIHFRQVSKISDSFFLPGDTRLQENSVVLYTTEFLKYYERTDNIKCAKPMLLIGYKFYNQILIRSNCKSAPLDSISIYEEDTYAEGELVQ